MTMRTIQLQPQKLSLRAAGTVLDVAGMNEVWSATAQHARATGQPVTLSVLDGSTTLRTWSIAPHGERTQLERTPAASTFTLHLAPWVMTVPSEAGPVEREVSTLSVARQQAEDAATSQNHDFTVAVTGADLDDVQVISPRPVVMVEDDEDELDSLEELFADEADAQDPKATAGALSAFLRKHRKPLIISSAAGAALFIGLVGGGILLANSTTNPSESAAAAAAQSPDTTSSPRIQTAAEAPAGFSVNAAWAADGATDQRSALTPSGSVIGTVSGRVLNIIDAETGEVRDTVHLPVKPDTAPVGFQDARGSGEGLVMTGGTTLMIWTAGDGLTTHTTSEKEALQVTGPTVIAVPKSTSTRPDAIRLLHGKDFETWKSPGTGASPITPVDGGMLWASSVDGGTLVTADAEGKTKSSTRLVGPSPSAKISRWLGASEKFVAVTWSETGREPVLALHAADTGEVVDTTSMGSGTATSTRAVLGLEKTVMLVGSTPVDLDTGRIGTRTEDLPSTTDAAKAVPGGWLLRAQDGTETIVTSRGSTIISPTSTETLVGLTGEDSVVVDHRGALARFDPAPPETP